MIGLMKILFICRANVGRSQAAAALYNEIHPNDAESAGTLVSNPSIALRDREKANTIINVLLENGIDISNNHPRQVDESLVEKFEKLIVMAEPESIPNWLGSNPKTIVWTIQDPKDQDIDTTRKIVNIIHSKIKEL